MATGKIAGVGTIYTSYKNGTVSIGSSRTDLGLSLELPPGTYIITLQANVQLVSGTTYPRMRLKIGSNFDSQYAAIMLGGGATQNQMVLTAMKNFTSTTTITGTIEGGNCSAFEPRTLQAVRIC